MFEYGPDGSRRLSKFGQRIVVLLIVVAMVLVATLWLVAHRQVGESAGGIITAGFALAGTLGMGVLTYGQGRRNEDILHHQNEKLEKIDVKVDGAMEATVAAIRQEWQRDRHDLKGLLVAQQLRTELAETELKDSMRASGKLEIQVHDLTERLARCAEAKGGGDKPC